MKKLILLLALGSLWSERAMAEEKWVGPCAYYASLAGADLYSTAYAEARGGYEANPIMRGESTRYALKALQVAGLTYLDHRAGQKSKKLQWGIRIAVGVGQGLIVAHNFRQAHK